MKILLVAPVKDSSTGLAQFPPIGLGYVAAALRKAGYRDVSILDCVLEGMTIDGFARYLRNFKPDVVGFNSWSVSVKEVGKSLDITKEIDPSIATIIGGPHPSALGEKAMDSFSNADYGFKGEAEVGAPLLMDYLSEKPVKLETIPGLMWRKNGDVRTNAQVFEKDLDKLGPPCWDLIMPSRYAASGTLIQKRTACIITTRGCPFPCTFCSAHITAGKEIRKRSVDNILEEIKELIYGYGIRRFIVFDENITLKHAHIKGFCNRIIDEGLDVSFELPNGIRLDTLNMEILRLMRKAGFSERVAVGIESGSARILKLMQKGLTKDEIKEKVELLNRAGFRPIGYFIIGFPTETREEMEETVRFAIELKLYRAGFMPFHPLPGTESFRFLVERGEIPEEFDWSELSTDNVAYAPEGLTRSELEMIRKQALLRFNLRPRIIWDYMRDYNSFKFAVRKLGNIFLKRRHAGRASLAEAH